MLRLNRLTIGFLLVLAALLLLVLPTIGSLFLAGFTSEETGVLSIGATSRVVTDPDIGPIIFNTVVYATISSIMAIGLGTYFALITERTNIPLRRLFAVLIIAPMAVPWFLGPFSWIFLLDPKIGLVNLWIQSIFGMSTGPFSIYCLPGMIWVTGTGFSFGYLLLASAFQNMDPAYEESARISGARMPTIFYKITMRLMLPAIFSVFLIEFVRVMEFLDSALILGYKRAYLSSRQGSGL